MNLKIIGSSSNGNCYILENDQEALIIECGVRMADIKKALNFRLNKVVGCLVSHEHLDHCKGVKELMTAGINVYSTEGTCRAMAPDMPQSRRLKYIEKNIEFVVGGFSVIAFEIKHDVADPVNFLINHKETGKVLFVTDTYYVPYTFRDLNNILVEANYSQDLLDSKLSSGELNGSLRDRIFKSHMSLNTCKELLSANDLTQVNNIVLIHLSNNNSDAIRFQKEVRELTGKNVHVAEAGLSIPFNKTPF